MSVRCTVAGLEQNWHFTPRPFPVRMAPGSAERAQAEVTLAAENLSRKDAEFTAGGNRFPTFENSSREVTASRYLLQPLGVDVNKWSMAVDKEMYSHVEFFKEIAKPFVVMGEVGIVTGICK